MQRSFTVLLLSLIIHQLSAQFVDDFSDGDFTSDPVWEGMTDRFSVESEILRLTAPEVSDESYLSVPSAGLDNGVWEFYVMMDFGTSGSNYSRVYLMSTASNLLESLNGYYVLIGQSADEISLYRQDGTSSTTLIDGIDKEIETDPVEVRIRVTRDASGNWELFQDLTGGSTFSSAGTATDNTYTISSFFGVRCTYTSTRHDLFYFDDFSVTGTPILDTEAPTISSVDVISQTEIDVTFSENVDETTAENTANYTITSGIAITNATLDGSNSSLVHLTTSALSNGSFETLTVSGVEDEAGNAITSAEAEFRYLEFEEPEENELLLTEVLFNPKTGGVDFVELFNNTADKFFNLQNWNFARINDGELEQVNPISEDQLVLGPLSYLALTEDVDILAFEYPMANPRQFVEIDDLPSYNDDEGTVVLLSPELDTVQFFSYSEDFHYALLEDEEGVSLERVVFTEDENDPNYWRSAASTAGFATPGMKNSQTLEAGMPAGKLTIDPKVFLPGNSGSGRDFTTINYEFNQGGQFANVMVYDQNGRPVKQLANGASLATSGFIRWDGETDRGGMARMGYYVVVFEVYNGNGKTETLKETVVVGRDF